MSSAAETIEAWKKTIELNKKLKVKETKKLPKKARKNVRHAPLPAMSPFVPDVPIVRQTLTKRKPMSAEVVEEIHKAGL